MYKCVETVDVMDYRYIIVNSDQFDNANGKNQESWKFSQSARVEIDLST